MHLHCFQHVLSHNCKEKRTLFIKQYQTVMSYDSLTLTFSAKKAGKIYSCARLRELLKRNVKR
jgi:hypothetical protein